MKAHTIIVYDGAAGTRLGETYPPGSRYKTGRLQAELRKIQSNRINKLKTPQSARMTYKREQHEI